MSLEEEEEELSAREILLTGLVAVVMAVVLFLVLPTAIVHFTKQFIGGVLGQNIVEGIIRIAFFLDLCLCYFEDERYRAGLHVSWS